MTTSAPGSSVLITRFGQERPSPRLGDLVAALGELYEEHPDRGHTESDYARHPTAQLRFTAEEGPTYTLTITRTREIRLEVFEDSTLRRPREPARTLQAVPIQRALEYWDWLATGEVEHLLSHFRPA